MTITHDEDELSGATDVEASGLAVDRLVMRYQSVVAVQGLSFDVAAGEFITLLGPSGCGKTTTLRAVAGLHRPDSGRITIGDEIVDDGTLHVGTARRDINMVFQSYAVWPHMTVFENVAYGLKSQRVPKGELRSRVLTMLDLVGLGEYASRHTTELSGGQQQRVALARALAPKPGLVLMDEPLSNLDAGLRGRMRSEIRRLQRTTGATVLYVTHDQEEALSMSDRVIVMRDGEIQQSGPPEEIYRNPVNSFVATFLGKANLHRATVETVAGRVATTRCPELSNLPLKVDTGRLVGAPGVGEEIVLVIRPESVVPQLPDLVRPGENVVRAELKQVEFLGSHVECEYLVGDAVFEVDVMANDWFVLGPAGHELGTAHDLTISPEAISWFAVDEVSARVEQEGSAR